MLGRCRRRALGDRGNYLLAGSPAWIRPGCGYFVGTRHEDLAVVTEPDARGQGPEHRLRDGRLCRSTGARSRAVLVDHSGQSASRRVAAKLGFTEVRRDVLHVIGA